jgi:hypothetical protein
MHVLRTFVMCLQHIQIGSLHVSLPSWLAPLSLFILVLTIVLPSFIGYAFFLLAYTIEECLPAFLSQDPGQASGFS